jgi:hypothetical protein
MAISLTVNGTTYLYPESGENPNWANGAGPTEWAQAVTDTLSTIVGPGDILNTTFAIDNNITVATDVNGLIFDSGTVRAANISYSVYRTSTANPAGHAETGTIQIVFDDSASVNSKWSLTQSSNGTAGIAFSMGDNGQMQYKTSDIGATGYSGVIKFSAKALPK